MKLLYVIVLNVIFFNFSFSQEGNVIGKISSSDNQLLNECHVSMAKLHSHTNSNGEFSFSNVKYGEYEIFIKRDGFKSLSQKINVNSPINNFSFVLKSDVNILQDVVIEVSKSSNEKTVEVGKIPIRAIDLPQSVAIIDKKVIQLQQAQVLSDVLKNANGIYISGNTGGYQEEISGRGFALGSSNTFKNGIRYNNSIMPEVSAIDRVEMIKGSTAILYGNVAAGGVFNLVTKKPQFENGGSVGFTVGSFDYYKPTFDLYGTIDKNKNVAYRVNSTYLKSGSFRDNVDAERFYINPSLLFKVGKKVEILIEGDYLSDNRTPDFGVGAIDYKLIDIPRSTFIGTKWSNIKTNQSSLSSSITYSLNDKWKLKSTNSIQGFHNNLTSSSRPNTSKKFIKTDGTWIRDLQKSNLDENYYISQLDLTGMFKTWNISHTLLIGADIDQYYSNTYSFKPYSNYDTINIFNIDIDNQRSDIPSFTKNTVTKTPRRRTGVYIQDFISLTKKLKLLAGIRFSYLESESNILTYSTWITSYSKTYDHAFSPRVGIVFQPINSMSIFTSYSNSFTPNTGVDINGDAIKPSIIDQYEIGVKNDFFKGNLSANITAYQITNSNVAQMVLDNGNTNSNIKELAGEIVSQGLELDVISKQWYGFNLIAGYQYNYTKYTKSNIYASGTKLNYQPQNTANFSIYYSLQNSKFKGLSFGLSSLYFGKRLGGRIPRLNVPNDTYRQMPLNEYFTIDASIAYSIKNLSFNFKVANIFDALSYNVHDDNSVNPIAPRTFMSTITVNF